jgi:hypothetical protein
MSIRHYSGGLVAGVALLAAAGSLQACAGPCASPCAETVAAPCAPAFRTITVNEWVPENYETTRTVYKTEYKTEKYTAYRTECVPETRKVSRTVTKLVPVVENQVRTTYKCVSSVENRTVTKSVVVCTPVTTVTRKCVDKGHYECVEVCKGPSLHDRIRMKCDPCYEPCPRYKTKKVWVSCPVWIETPCTKIVRSVQCVTEVVPVTVNKLVPVEETVKVCTMKCVSEVVEDTVTVYTRKCVAFEATRCVAVCVPVVEKVTACRMVCRTVTKQVPVCEPCCEPTCGRKHRRCCR